MLRAVALNQPWQSIGLCALFFASYVEIQALAWKIDAPKVSWEKIWRIKSDSSERNKAD
jgi:hypothetical protein